MSDHFVCDHPHVGTVYSGDVHSGPFWSVATCYNCVPKAQRFVHARAGRPASQLLTYEEYRRQKRAGDA